MARRRTTTPRSNQAVASGLRFVSDHKNLHRLRKLLGALDVPSEAAQIQFTMGDEPTVSWFMQAPEEPR